MQMFQDNNVEGRDKKGHMIVQILLIYGLLVSFLKNHIPIHALVTVTEQSYVQYQYTLFTGCGLQMTGK